MPVSQRRQQTTVAVRRGKHRPAPATQTVGADYCAVFERTLDAVFVADFTGRHLAVNQAACRLTGYSRKELLETRVSKLAIRAERAEAKRHLDEIRAKGRSTRTATLKRRDGTNLLVELHGIDLGNGTYMNSTRKVCDSNSGQEELARSHDAYRTLIDVCHVAVISAGSNGRIASWNPAAEALFGYSEAEAVGLRITALIPPGERRRHLAGFRMRAQSKQKTRVGQTIHADGLRKDGTIISLEVSIAVGSKGPAKMFTAVIRDVTQQHEMVERLNDALQRLQFHVERMPLAYIVWDVNFRVVEWNPAAERIFGYRRREALGKHAYRLIVPPEIHPTVDSIWANLLKGDASGQSINDNIRKDGSRLTCEWFNTPIRDGQGRIHAICSMAMDVSEREAMETQLRNAQKLESLGVLAGGVAHDFNSALMVILGNTSLLRSVRGLPAGALPHIELIEDAGIRASEFIKHLLAFARTGRHSPARTDLNQAIHHAVTFMRSSFGERYRFDVQRTKTLPAILADQSQLEQIILNLCLNAKQAMPRGGTIGLGTRRTTLTAKRAAMCLPPNAPPGTYIELTVHDGGCGMDCATVSRIFDPFFSTKTEGHGLGLAAVLGILRQHNALVLVKSRLGQGTRMHLFFPLHRESPKRDRGKRRKPAASPRA